MKNVKYILAVIVVVVLSIGTSLALPADRTQPASAATSCPAPTSEGAYNQLGTDDNGNAICHFVYSNACPYTEAVSADDPMCYKAQVSQQSITQSATPPIATAPATPTVNQCGGK